MVTDSHNSGFFSPERQLVEEDDAPLMEIGHSDGPFVLYKCSRQGRIVVLKCIREQFHDNPLYWDMLRKEFEIGHSLNHPNIREYHSLSDHPRFGICIEMEWIDGDPLEKLLPECRKDTAFRDKIARQLLDAIRFLHLKQVIHRDLKPENILISRNGRNVKLIDFSLSDSDSHLVLKGNAGTARYASPEQMACRPTDPRSDIYSLGVRLGEMSDSRRFRKVSQICTQRNPDARYPDIDSLAKALFAPSILVPGIAAAILALAFAATIIWITQPEEEEVVEIEAIEEIFRQATDLVEESDVNPRN